MFKKIILLFILLLSILHADYQEVRIGNIDDYYEDKITEQQIREMIDEIEYVFEDRLNIDIFGYSEEDGKDIDIVYLPASKLEKTINQKIENLNEKKEKLNSYYEDFEENGEKISSLRNAYIDINNTHNSEVEEFNEYIQEVNSGGRLSQNEYKDLKNYEKKQKRKFNKQIKTLNKKKRQLENFIYKHNKRVKLYNRMIQEHNILHKELEGMLRNHKKLKGRTFGEKETILETYYLDGEEVTEENSTVTMNKIEIYGFNSLEEFKVILAHEIAHLVGIPHLEEEGALMNPVLQQSQLEKLELTEADVVNFEQYF